MSDAPTQQVERLLELVRQLYLIHPVGGPLHVALDDGNLPRMAALAAADKDNKARREAAMKAAREAP